MISRSSLAHIRIPQSYYLMPVFFLALFSAGHVDPVRAWTVFIVLHFLVYPASNGFNSFYDRDTDSIGTLKRPPAVTGDLLWFSLALDVCGLAIALAVGPVFLLGCFVYGCSSKAYSWDRIRLKKYPVAGWLFTSLGQGALTFLLVALSVGDARVANVLNFRIWFAALTCGLFVSGFYPLSQIFQHHEDRRRRDTTISMVLGIQGTLYFSLLILAVSIAALFFYFKSILGIGLALIFFIMVVPAAVYLGRWFHAVRKNAGAADYDHATRISILASSGINLFSLFALLSVAAG
jgi:4-hydroxybenzoate polyprenyltransferase